MRYISLFVGGILALVSCDEVKVAGSGGVEAGNLSAGFRDSVVTVFENEGSGTVYVDFSSALTQATKVVFSVVEEKNIQENKDYFFRDKEVSVAAGSHSTELNFSLIDDPIVNDERSFSLRLVSVNGGMVDTAASLVRVKVLDDESEIAVGFEEATFMVAEQEDGASSYVCRIPVKVYGTLQKPLQFKVAVKELEEEQAAVENVHFRLQESVFVVENTNSEVVIPVEIFDDNEVNADRKFALDIIEATGCEIYTAQRRCIVTIKNDDMGIYFGRTNLEAEESAGTVRIPVKLTKKAEQAVTFTVACGGSAVENTDYTLKKTWTIEAGQDSVDIEIELKDLPAVSSDRLLELQFAAVGEGIQVFEAEGRCTLKILDCSTGLAFAESSRLILNDSTHLSLPVQLTNAVEHDVTFQVKITARNGVSESQVALLTSEVTIPTGSLSGQVELSLQRLTLSKQASFTIEIQNVYGASMAAINSCTVNKYYKFQTTALSIVSYSSQEDGGGEAAPSGYAAAAIDGSESSFWHTNWSGGGTGGINVLPEGIVIALPDHFHLWGVEVLRRVAAANSDNKKAEFYLSDETTDFGAGTWGTALGNVVWDKCSSTDRAEHVRTLFLPASVSGKYLKISVTESYRNTNAQIAEVVVFGYTD